MRNIYTKTGDLGETSLVGGTRISKGNLIVDVYGTIDELNATVGVTIAEMEKNDASHYPHYASLCRIQDELFEMESFVATEPEEWNVEQISISMENFIKDLEREIDEMQQTLSPLTSFILPRGSMLIALLHLNRTICRRTERLAVRMLPQSKNYQLVVKYFNRLSDFFFILIRFIHKTDSISECYWKSKR